MLPKSRKSIGTRILIMVIGIVGLAFVTIGFIGSIAFKNLADGFLHIVEVQNKEFGTMLNRNSERAKNRFIEMFEENARAKGETLIARDSLNLKSPFLDNSYTQVREALQNSFNFDSSMLLAAFVVLEGDQIKAWQYIDREHKEGLSLPIVYDSNREVWVSNFQGQPVLVYDPGMENLRNIEKPTLRKVQVTVSSGEQRRTVAAYEAIVPICESTTDNLADRIKEGEAVAYLRYLISLELLDQAVAMEENEMAEMNQAQRNITQTTLENTLMDANRRLGALAVTLISAGIGVLLLAFVISLWLSRKIAQPIEILSEAANRIAEGDYEHAVAIQTSDEIGRLGQSFESMRVQVKTFTENLQVLVDQRTAALNEALQTVTAQSQKIREIMNQIDQGILTIDVQQRVEAEYSRHLNRLYPEAPQDLKGVAVLDLVFAGSTLSAEDLSLIQQSLAACLDSDSLNWDTNGDNFPRQVQYQAGRDLRTYELHWTPIIEGEIIRRFLLTIRDKTKELALEAQVQAAAASNTRLTQALTDLVSVRADAVGAMLRDSHQALLEIEQGQILREGDHRRNYVRLHTMKGGARSLGLKALALAIHEAELCPQGYFRSGFFDEAGFRQSIAIVRDELDFLRDVAGRILKIKIDDRDSETRTLFEMLAEELREAETLCRDYQVELGGLVIEDRVIHWQPRFLVDAVQAARHALTNSLDHGYFKPIKEGKLSADEKVFFRVRAFCEGNHVILEFQDEGFGFDRDAIRAQAERLGVTLHSDDDYMNVLLRDGLSTAKEVTQLSGRGAGLSAIQTFAEEWKGHLQLMDHHPRGSRIRITLPIERVLGAAFVSRRKDPASA